MDSNGTLSAMPGQQVEAGAFFKTIESLDMKLGLAGDLDHDCGTLRGSTCWERVQPWGEIFNTMLTIMMMAHIDQEFNFSAFAMKNINKRIIHERILLGCHGKSVVRDGGCWRLLLCRRLWGLLWGHRGLSQREEGEEKERKGGVWLTW